MAELRRLLIRQNRLRLVDPIERSFRLEVDEIHYLRRVLRLNQGDSFEIIDGVGHLWEASYQTDHSCKLQSPFDSPKLEEPRPRPRLGLAVVIPKRGFDQLLRMTCQLGVDLIQPLSSERITCQAGLKKSRCDSIIREACEQSERLWEMEINDLLEAEDWWKAFPTNTPFALATTRKKELKDFNRWIREDYDGNNEVWIAIGPEGGWTELEEKSAIRSGGRLVHLGDLILTTSTAAVAVSNTMASWRRSDFVW